MQINAKRKQSVAGLTNGGRAVKRRASKACQCCRSRKGKALSYGEGVQRLHSIVRCDVVESGVPCTNCRLDEVDCCVSDSKRRKKSLGDGEVTNHSPVSSFDESDEAVPQFPAYDAGNDIPGWSAPPDDSTENCLPSTQLEAELTRHVPHMLCMYFCEARNHMEANKLQTKRRVIRSPKMNEIDDSLSSAQIDLPCQHPSIPAAKLQATSLSYLYRLQRLCQHTSVLCHQGLWQMT